jgi:KEOPS complex subunit Pcc1
MGGYPLALHEAVFRFKSDHAKKIFDALQPEMPDEVNPRSTTRCSLEGEDTLVLAIEAQDTASLRAALNMYLRLVNVADEVASLVDTT